MPKIDELTLLAKWSFAQSWYEGLYKEEITVFFGKDGYVREKYPPEEEAVENSQIRYNQWLMFDHRVPLLGMTPLERLIEVNKDDLSDETMEVLRGFQEKNFLSFFEVMRVRRGKSMELKDCIDNQIYSVEEHRGTLDITTGNVMITRLVPYHDSWIITGGAGVYPGDVGRLIRLGLHELATTKKKDRFSAPFLEQNVFQKYGADRLSLTPLEELRNIFKQSRSKIAVEEVVAQFEQDIGLDEILEQCLRSFDKKPKRSTLQELMDALNRLHEQYGKGKKSATRGPLEMTLLQKCSAFVMQHARTDDYIDEHDAQPDIDRLTRRFLDTTHPALDGKTPRQAIIEERQTRGDHERKIGIKLEFKVMGMSPNDEAIQYHNRATEAMKAGDIVKSLKIAQKVLELARQHGPWPEIFRTFHNIGIAYASLGNRKRAETFFKASVELNPDYEQGKGNLAVLKEYGVKPFVLKHAAEVLGPKGAKQKELKRWERLERLPTLELLKKVSELICESLTEEGVRIQMQKYASIEDFLEKEWEIKSTATRGEEEILWIATDELWERLVPEKAMLDEDMTENTDDENVMDSEESMEHILDEISDEDYSDLAPQLEVPQELGIWSTQKSSFISGRKRAGRNDSCPCGAKDTTGRAIKFKRCHGKA